MKPSLLNLFVITRRCLSDKEMPGSILNIETGRMQHIQC